MKKVVQIRTVPRPSPFRKSWPTGEPGTRAGTAKRALPRSAAGTIRCSTALIRAGSVARAAR